MHTQASWYHSVSYCIILDRLLSMRSTYELRRYEFTYLCNFTLFWTPNCGPSLAGNVCIANRFHLDSKCRNDSKNSEKLGEFRVSFHDFRRTQPDGAARPCTLHACLWVHRRSWMQSVWDAGCMRDESASIFTSLKCWFRNRTEWPK